MSKEWKMGQIFVAFPENLNFIKICISQNIHLVLSEYSSTKTWWNYRPHHPVQVGSEGVEQELEGTFY